jgi:hypothetical protein
MCVIALVLAASPIARADEVSKEVCIDSHSRGQDAREQNKLTLAKKLFLTCAQPTCPALVQGDCARFADDLTRMLPSVNFAARDGRGVDLPDTSVFVDDILVKSRLDDGKAFDMDPGRHTVKFVHSGKEQIMSVVVGTGERGRAVTVTFGAPPAAPSAPALDQLPVPTPAPKPAKPTTHHAYGSKLVIGAGAIAAVGGGALAVFGITRMPSNCSLSTHECAAPPGDPAFHDASQAIKLSNIGFLVGGVGVAAAVGGVVWYVTSGRTDKPRGEHLVMPWLSPSGAGIALTGRL